MYVYSCTHIDRIVYVYFRHARGPTKPYLLARDMKVFPYFRNYFRTYLRKYVQYSTCRAVHVHVVSCSDNNYLRWYFRKYLRGTSINTEVRKYESTSVSLPFNISSSVQQYFFRTFVLPYFRTSIKVYCTKISYCILSVGLLYTTGCTFVQ